MGDNSGKSRFYIDNSVWRIDMQKQYFDIQEIQNRRFMYNPDTCTLILGRQYGKSNKVESSHAEEHSISGTAEPYDHFIRGWIGTSDYYKHGIIHFAPPVDMGNDAMYTDAYNTLQMFRENGAAADTEVRGFGDVWEQSLSNILPGFTKQSKGKGLINMPMTESKRQLLLQELAKIGFTEAFYIPASDNIMVQPDNDRMPYIRGDDMIFYGSEYDSLVEEKIKPLVNKVNDMIAEREKPQYYGVWAVRSAASIVGSGEAWNKIDGIPLVYTSKEVAVQQALKCNEKTASPNVHYSAQEMEPEIAKSALQKWAEPPEKPYLKVFIQTPEERAKYSDVGEWLTFPANAGDLSGLLERLNVSGSQESGFFVTKIESSIGSVCNALNISEKLDELNMLAHDLDDMAPFELDNLRAILQSGEFNYGCGAATLINLMYEDNFTAFNVIDAGGAKELGQYWEKEAPDAITEGMTPEEYGKECIAEENGAFTPWGYVYKKMELTQLYNGVVPAEYAITDAALQIVKEKAVDKERAENPVKRPSVTEKLNAAKKAVKPPAPGGSRKKKDIEMG